MGIPATSGKADTTRSLESIRRGRHGLLGHFNPTDLPGRTYSFLQLKLLLKWTGSDDDHDESALPEFDRGTSL